ncbi:MAG: membrane protein insertase YidC [Pseudomonadota bacterium]
MMDDQNRNLLLAMALSMLVILVWFWFFPPEEPTPPLEPATVTDSQPALEESGTAAPQPSVGPSTGGTQSAAAALPEEAPRTPIETERLTGSISLQGGRIDDLSLRDYRETLDPEADIVHVLNPSGELGAYYALYGWVPGGDLDFEDVPGADTAWSLVSGEELTQDTPITLAWDNGAGLRFERTIAVDEDFLFTVRQSVTNTTAASVRLAPYGVVTRQGLPDDLKGFFILHEGAIGMYDGELAETNYDGMTDLGADPLWGPSAQVVDVAENGWLGFTDHYWMTALIPEPGTPFKAVKRISLR